MDKQRERVLPARIEFTDKVIARAWLPKKGQRLLWHKGGQKGLGLLIGAGGTKTFFSQFKLGDKWCRRTLGRFGEMARDDGGEDPEVNAALALVREDRRLAKQGVDPRTGEGEAKTPKPKDVFESVADDFIRLYAQPSQRSWKASKHALKVVCGAWLAKPIRTITRKDAQDLVDGMIAAGHAPKAARTLSVLRKFWRWCWKRDLVDAPIMDAVECVYEKQVRDRVYDDDEVRQIWKAAGKLTKVEESYFKLLLLLAPRKTALAQMERSHLKLDGEVPVWVTPFELTKSKKTMTKKRTYVTPLPPLAVRMLKALLPKKEDDNPYVFRGRGRAPLSVTGLMLQRKLIKAGAPADFTYHACRHTAATWLEDHGHDEFDRALILNHSSGSVTAGYSHGLALKRKASLLTKWSDHVEAVVAKARPAAVRRVRAGKAEGRQPSPLPA